MKTIETTSIADSPGNPQIDPNVDMTARTHASFQAVSYRDMQFFPALQVPSS